MAISVSNLRLLDNISVAKEYDLASELFHRINRIIPEDQSILTVPPTCRVREAIALMRNYGYSQVPVVENGEVLGVFSFRSFAYESASATLEEWNKQKCAPGDLTVDEFLEQFEFARVTEEMSRVFNAMDRDNGILIGTPYNLIGILTPIDFLRYLNKVASPFVLVWEIELALRALINIAMNKQQIEEASKRCLSSAYGGEGNMPTLLVEMTFNNYRSIISHGDSWRELKNFFGGTRTRVSAKLKQIGQIRNDLFHFKRELTVPDHEILSGHRNWLLNKIKQAEAYRKKETRP